MKKLTTLAAAALALAMTGAGALAETTLQLGTTVNEQDSFQVAAEKFAEVPEQDLLEDIRAFLIKGAKDGDAPASCS